MVSVSSVSIPTINPSRRKQLRFRCVRSRRAIARGQHVFNEIMSNPLLPDAEYIELFNNLSNYAFDLSGWSVNGLSYTFPNAR